MSSQSYLARIAELHFDGREFEQRLDAVTAIHRDGQVIASARASEVTAKMQTIRAQVNELSQC